MDQELVQVGRVVATEAKPSTAYSFSFWAADGDNKVGIGTLVVMKKGDLEVYGVVVEGFGFTDLNSAMHDYIGSEGDPGPEAPTLRHEVKCYTRGRAARESGGSAAAGARGAGVSGRRNLLSAKALRMDRSRRRPASRSASIRTAICSRRCISIPSSCSGPRPPI